MSAKDIVYQNDQRLMELAGYYESKGLILQVQDPSQLFSRFSEFKRLVKKGEFTMEELEEKVYSQYGITTLQNYSIDLKDMLINTLKMTQELQKKEKKIKDQDSKE